MAGLGLDLNTTQDNAKNLKRCLEAYADALDAAASVFSGTFHTPPTRTIIANNFEDEALKAGRSLAKVLGDIEKGCLGYESDFSKTDLPDLAPSARALKAAVEAAQRLTKTLRRLENAEEERREAGRPAMTRDDLGTTRARPAPAPSNLHPAAKPAKSATPGINPRMAASAPMPAGAPRPTTDSSHPTVLPATPSAAPIPAAPAAPSSTAAFAPIPPTLSQKEKLKQAIDQLFLRSPADFPSIGLPGWGLLRPTAASPDKYQLSHSSKSTHPDIHIEVQDDAGLAFMTEKLGAGAPTADFFKDYFTVIFKSLEASGQKYQLQNSLRDLLAGLQAQHGLANTAEIETGFKNSVTALGGPSTLKNFLQGQTLIDFEAMANPPAGAGVAAAAPSRLHSGVPPHSPALSGASPSPSAGSSPLPPVAPRGSTGATHSTGSSTSTSGASTPFSAASLAAAGSGAGVSQHDAAVNGRLDDSAIL